MKAKFAILVLSLLLAACLLASPAYADGRRGRSRRARRGNSWRHGGNGYSTGPSNPTNPTTSTGNLKSESTQTANVDNDQKIKSIIVNTGDGDVYSTNKNKATNVALNANVPVNVNGGSSGGSSGSSSTGNLNSDNTQTAKVNNDQKIKSIIVNTGDGNVYSDNENKATNAAINANVPVNVNGGSSGGSSGSSSTGNLDSDNTQAAQVNNNQKIKSIIVNTGDGNVYSTNKNKATNVAANLDVPVNVNGVSGGGGGGLGSGLPVGALTSGSALPLNSVQE